MPGLRHVKTAPYNPNPKWIPPEAIAAHADKLEDRITHPPEGLLYADNDAYLAFCQTWFGPTKRDGQAFIRVHGADVPIHRFAYLLWVDDVPEGLFARPIVCGTRLCVSRYHMRLVARGYRQRKLTTQQREDIRWFYYLEDGAWTQERLADTYGVSRSLIHSIVSRRDA